MGNEIYFMWKLKTTPEGKLGYTSEDVMVWADYYENIQKKISNNEELEWHELDSLSILLQRTAKTMREKPHKFLEKKPRGRPTRNTKAFYSRQIQIFRYLGVAKNISEARKKLAIQLLDKEKLDFSKKTYDDYLEDKIKTIEAQTRNLKDF